MSYELVIGDKNTSSWSLRPWLAMKVAGIPFSEIQIALRKSDTKEKILLLSPSGHVPALLMQDADGHRTVIWDSLAILEYLAEAHPGADLWPASRPARARARAVSAEMHSGFQALREHCPMDFIARSPKAILPENVANEVQRIVALWHDCRRTFGTAGPFLFGSFSAVDAMYAPVASRFRTYIPSLARYGDEQGVAEGYVETLFALPQIRAWEEGARMQLGGVSP